MAVVVRDQDRFGRVVDDRPEEQLQLFGTVLQKPAAAICACGCGVHGVRPFPVDPRSHGSLKDHIGFRRQNPTNNQKLRTAAKYRLTARYRWWMANSDHISAWPF